MITLRNSRWMTPWRANLLGKRLALAHSLNAPEPAKRVGDVF